MVVEGEVVVVMVESYRWTPRCEMAISPTMAMCCNRIQCGVGKLAASLNSTVLQSFSLEAFLFLTLLVLLPLNTEL